MRSFGSARAWLRLKRWRLGARTVDRACNVGPHWFPAGAILCERCSASLSGALLDMQGVRPAAGVTFARHPECAP